MNLELLSRSISVCMYVQTCCWTQQLLIWRWNGAGFPLSTPLRANWHQRCQAASILSCTWPWASGGSPSALTHSPWGFLVETIKKNEKTMLQPTRMAVFIARNLNHIFHDLSSSLRARRVATSSIWCPSPQKWGVVGANCPWRQRANQSWGLRSWSVQECSAQDLLLVTFSLAV